MDVQDCKYYEARAKDVNLEDITSSEQNAAILARLRDNDPTFTAISIEDGPQVESNFVAREGDCMGWLGYFVGRSKQCAHNIALMLGQQSTLKYLNFEETNLMDEMLVEIAAALSSQPQLEELDLGSNNIARNGCVALGLRWRFEEP
ncbi:hypothetical protein QTG54_017061 [Skeletonema marinoi]|uniref:Uncharacterized protein n=1 Tax=Skeletonema marinoi TaxID=267567 RepID=A0AAD9D389_9STRA|nr:hypothetical protein QTG54_017061 [Skeletonema marinoi]